MLVSRLGSRFCLKPLIACIALALLAGLTIAGAQTQSEQQEPKEKKRYGISSIAFSLDGKLVALVKGNLRPERYYGYNGYTRYEGYVNYNSQVEVWELASGKLSRLYSDFGGPVLSVCFSPDGNQIATASWELNESKPFTKRAYYYESSGVVKVWDIKTGELKWAQKSPHSDITSLVYSPDGNSLLVAGTIEGFFSEVKVYDAREGTLRRTIGLRSPIGAIAFSPDGKTLAVRKTVLSESRCEVKIYEFPSCKEQRTIQESKEFLPGPEIHGDLGTFTLRRNDMKNIVFSPDGKKLAIRVSGFKEKEKELINQILIYDVQTGRQEQLIPVSKNPLPVIKTKSYKKYAIMADLTRRNVQLVNTIIYLADGNRIAMLNRDGIMKVWNVQTGEMQWSGQSDRPATSVAFLPGGRLVAIADYDDVMTIWDAQTGEQKHIIKSPFEDRNTLDVGRLIVSIEPVLSLAFSADGYVLASASGSDVVRIWDARAAVEKTKIARRNAGFTSVAFSPDGKTIATGNRDGDLIVWGAEKGEQLISTGGEAPVNSVAFSTDGNAIAAASADGAVKLWESQTGKLKLSFDGHSSAALCVSFSPDGKILASASADGMIAMWNAQTGELMRSMKHNAAVSSIAFSPDGRMLASGSADKAVQLWDAGTGELKKTMTDHDDSINTVAFSPDGNMLATGSDDKTVRLWNPQTGKSIRTMKGHDASVHTLAFSPDGNTLAAGTGNNVIVFWNPQSGELKRLLKESVKLPTRTR